MGCAAQGVAVFVENEVDMAAGAVDIIQQQVRGYPLLHAVPLKVILDEKFGSERICPAGGEYMGI